MNHINTADIDSLSYLFYGLVCEKTDGLGRVGLLSYSINNLPGLGEGDSAATVREQNSGQ